MSVYLTRFRDGNNQSAEDIDGLVNWLKKEITNEEVLSYISLNGDGYYSHLFIVKDDDDLQPIGIIQVGVFITQELNNWIMYLKNLSGSYKLSLLSKRNELLYYIASKYDDKIKTRSFESDVFNRILALKAITSLNNENVAMEFNSIDLFIPKKSTELSITTREKQLLNEIEKIIM